MTALPHISLVIPARNEERNVRACLESVQGLRYPQELLEIIVVDGASSDRTVAIARGFQEVIVYETHPEIPTAAYGLNYGIERATGEYVQYLAADCRLDPYWLQKAINQFRKDTSGTLAVVGGQTIEAGARNSVFSFLLSLGLKAGGSVSGEVLHNAGTGLIKRSVIQKIRGGFRHDFVSEDEVEFGFRIRLAGLRFLKIPESMIYHNLDLPNSWSGLRQMLLRYWRVGIGWGQLQDVHGKLKLWIEYMRGNLRFFAATVFLYGALVSLIISFFLPWAMWIFLACLSVWLAGGFVSTLRFHLPFHHSLLLTAWYIFTGQWMVYGYLWYRLTHTSRKRPQT